MRINFNLIALSLLATMLLQAIACEGQTVAKIAAGGYHSLVLKSDGSLWAMGHNVAGQLGDAATELATNQPEQILAGGVTAIAAGSQHSLFISRASWATELLAWPLVPSRFCRTASPQLRPEACTASF
jgi:alpha-tubulin suppressor-like RCC1 family protein